MVPMPFDSSWLVIWVFGIVLKDSIRVVAYSGFAAGPARNAERCEGMKDTDGLAVGCEGLKETLVK